MGTFAPAQNYRDITEGRYDTISNKISGDIFKYWKENLEKEVNRFEKKLYF